MRYIQYMMAFEWWSVRESVVANVILITFVWLSDILCLKVRVSLQMAEQRGRELLPSHRQKQLHIHM